MLVNLTCLTYKPTTTVCNSLSVTLHPQRETFHGTQGRHLGGGIRGSDVRQSQRNWRTHGCTRQVGPLASKEAIAAPTGRAEQRLHS